MIDPWVIFLGMALGIGVGLTKHECRASRRRKRRERQSLVELLLVRREQLLRGGRPYRS